MRPSFITGIDIGSSTIRCAVAQKSPSPEGLLQIIGLADTPSEGVFKGTITSIEDTVSSLTACLEKVERMTGNQVDQSFVGLGGPSVLAQLSKGVVAVSRADKEIKSDDVGRVIEAAQAVAVPPNYEILHILPRSYTIDNTPGIKDPVGMTGIRLEVEALILEGLSSQINTFTRVVHRTGIEVSDVVLGPLACAEALLTRRQKELGVALVNIGAATLSLLVFVEGDLVHAKIFPVGSSYITSDIAIGLRIPIDLAEQIKTDYGVASSEAVQKREEISFQDNSSEEGSFSRKYLAEIIEARLEEMCALVDGELKKIGSSGLLPFGIVLTGGGSGLQGIIDVVKRELRLPVSCGLPKNINSAIDKINDPVFSTAIGLAAWGKEFETQKQGHRQAGFGQAGNAMKRFFKSLMP